ncbi:ATP synthase subunit b [Verrucomicrobiota bacterium]|jgi:F-type H+-transporting ATPase subunit b|nr:ATP synthase subunit b [Verrucomicrobiota bacterium]
MTFLSALLAADAAPAAAKAAAGAAPVAPATNPAETIIQLFGSFGVDGPHLLIQLINFSILAFILYRFAIKPALGQMEERNRLIEKGLADAQAATQRLADAQKASDAKLNAASDEAAKMLADARNAAKAAVEAAKAEATAAQTEVIAKAKAAIEADRVKMMNEVRGEVSRLVVETAAKVLEQNLDDATRGRLNEAAVKQLAR